MPEIDSQVRKFLTSEKPSNTDYSHKCVAKKFHTWMLQCCLETNPEKKLSLSRRQIKAVKEWKYDLPPHQLPELLIRDNIFARFLMYCLLELKNKKASLRSAHGWLSFTSGGKMESMKNTKNVYSKIKKRPVYKDHMPKKALVPKPKVHVKIGAVSNTSLYDAYAIFIYNLSVLLSRRGDEAHKLTTRSIRYEKDRMFGGYNRPRVSFNILSNKEDPEGERRLMSMNGTRECVMECYTCSEHHNIDNPRCPLSSFEKV